MERVSALLEPENLEPLTLGALWRLSERLERVQQHVDPLLLAIDLRAHPDAARLWSAFVARASQVKRCLGVSCKQVAQRVRSSELGPEAFRAGWQALGYVPNDGDAGTPADDYLDGLFHTARFSQGEGAPEGGSPNMATRAGRAADFLSVVEPGRSDVVIDLGSGSGKLALTVSASTFTRVVGVEYGSSYVDVSRATASELSLRNVSFVHADVRDINLAEGSVFYLYYPFHGAVAQTIAQSLGHLAETKDITVYTSGPTGGYGEHFLKAVEPGGLRLVERRGEFGEVLLLRSDRT